MEEKDPRGLSYPCDLKNMLSKDHIVWECITSAEDEQSIGVLQMGIMLQM